MSALTGLNDGVCVVVYLYQSLLTIMHVTIQLRRTQHEALILRSGSNASQGWVPIPDWIHEFF
jgi:hypothetical protein